MKNKMPSRKSIGKESTFLSSLRRKNNRTSDVRRSFRNPENIPSSTKVGAGAIVARRRLPKDILHKRNHRSNEIIKG